MGAPQETVKTQLEVQIESISNKVSLQMVGNMDATELLVSIVIGEALRSLETPRPNDDTAAEFDGIVPHTYSVNSRDERTNELLHQMQKNLAITTQDYTSQMEAMDGFNWRPDQAKDIGNKVVDIMSIVCGEDHRSTEIRLTHWKQLKDWFNNKN